MGDIPSRGDGPLALKPPQTSLEIAVVSLLADDEIRMA